MVPFHILLLPSSLPSDYFQVNKCKLVALSISISVLCSGCCCCCFFWPLVYPFKAYVIEFIYTCLFGIIGPVCCHIPLIHSSYSDAFSLLLGVLWRITFNWYCSTHGVCLKSSHISLYFITFYRSLCSSQQLFCWLQVLVWFGCLRAYVPSQSIHGRKVWICVTF